MCGVKPCHDEIRRIRGNAAGIAVRQLVDELWVVQSFRKAAARIRAEQVDLCIDGLHAVEKPVGPTPHPFRDIDRDEQCPLAASIRDITAPAQCGVSCDALRERRAAQCMHVRSAALTAAIGLSPPQTVPALASGGYRARAASSSKKTFSERGSCPSIARRVSGLPSRL